MQADIHAIDAGDSASALLARAVAALASGGASRVVAVGGSEGRAMLARAGLRIDSWACPPCGIMRLAARPLARAVAAACGSEAPGAVTCWSADPARASALAHRMWRALPRADVGIGSLNQAADALRNGLDSLARAGASADAGDGFANELREAIGAGAESLVVLGAADAPMRANSLRMLDVAGRAMLAGADAHLVLPSCMPHMARTRRYARGLGLDRRLHVIDGAEWPVRLWHGADMVLTADESPLVHAAAAAVGVRVVAAPGQASDESVPARREAAAGVRDSAATELLAAARARAQFGMNASAAAARACAQSAMNASAASA